MPITESSVAKETKDRYLTYALSVVTSRALPDVRDGLKPVQRRILYAAFHNLKLHPEGTHRKSAAVVGEVLAKFHPHGDIACYEAMVRMAQDFSLRYPLIDGQGNFGSLDGDNAAAYRYTEVKLMPLAVEVLGELHEETVDYRENFDVSTIEPIVLPSRVPLLLMNGASGIAVGMATNIPPHNLKDLVKALLELSKNPETTDARIASLVKGPDFPTGCLVLNSKAELQSIYSSGRGSVRMRGAWKSEEGERGKELVVVSSIPYGINKAQLVEKIASLIIDRKLPQLVDIRDESTDDIRIVLELAPGASAELAMVYLFKHTNLESTFPVNLTVLVPDENQLLKPEQVSLRTMLSHFLLFREEVTVKRFRFELKQLLARIHLLEGLLIIFDHLDEVIAIVRKSEGRADSSKKLQARFQLSEIQALAIVDMRIYQLSRTSLDDITEELIAKRKRAQYLETTLQSTEAIRELVRFELEELSQKYGDKRRSPLEQNDEVIEFDESQYLVQEDVFALVTRDGWIKRIRANNDVSSTRIREGDTLAKVHTATTLDTVVFITNQGSLFSLKVSDFPSSGGFGTPIQKLLKFKDDESVIQSFLVTTGAKGEVHDGTKVLLLSKRGFGSVVSVDGIATLKRSGKRVAKLKDDDELCRALTLNGTNLVVATKKAQVLRIKNTDIPHREGASLGVTVISLKGDDEVVGGVCGDDTADIQIDGGSRKKDMKIHELTLSSRASRGEKFPGLTAVLGISRVSHRK
jgi:DNA gyrase subunit A